MIEEAKQKIASCGIRCTHQRAIVYATLRESRAHPTAEEIYTTIMTRHPDLGVSMATVYNTLEALCDVGLARKHAGSGKTGSARYDAECKCHPHLRDRESGRIVDLPPDLASELFDALPQNMIERIREQTGFDVQRICFELVGSFKNGNADNHPTDI
ncbi:Peroxide-responsive repressor PerR [Mucisphaera calidilacus]|uniref:Peroxide-responsive repressor PerR n=2 Tax=Mucisphaera calidilacus TaxID=2527982 RepID=A0A518BZI0_9BACT|nr:Peroxide-responsive repressor PerR [Mucisphaera calidilacus]